MDDSTYLSVTETSFQDDDTAMQIVEQSTPEPSEASPRSESSKESSKDKKKSRSDKKKRTRLTEQIQISKSEIVFITEINQNDKTFFGQLARYSNEELREYGGIIDKKLDELFKQNGPATKTNKGNLVGARFSDGKWYRAIVEDKSNTNKQAIVNFIDWGNLYKLGFEDIVEDTNKIEEMHRDPFGIFCSYDCLKDDNVNETRMKSFFNYLPNRYLLIKPKEKIKEAWRVEIPMVGYNSRFWRAVIPGWILTPSSIKENPFKFIESGCKNTLDSTMVECKN